MAGVSRVQSSPALETTVRLPLCRMAFQIWPTLFYKVRFAQFLKIVKIGKQSRHKPHRIPDVQKGRFRNAKTRF